MQRAGAGDLYNRMEVRLLSLAQNPFLLWAIVQSCVGLPSHELPKNVGQLYENLIEGYIFGKREISKPQESRPTRYNYLLVKKPVLARLAIAMCQQGTTRSPESDAMLKSIRDHLHELRDANAGIRLLQPHAFMPAPVAKELLDETVENGILQRFGTTLEFMHESVRDYFAAVELSAWPVEKILRSVSPLIWRRAEPGYHELQLEGTLVQAAIMTSGLRADSGTLLQELVGHHPLLAAHCFAGARDIAPELEEDLLKRWLALLDRRLKRYRWVGCQCLGAAKVRSTAIARRLFEVIRSDPEWEVRKSAARAFAAINDPQMTKVLVAEAVNAISENRFGDNLGNQFRYLQTDALVVELLTIWGESSQTDTRKRRAEELLARMRRSSLREALQRLAGESGKAKAGAGYNSQWAQSALDVLDSWKPSIHGEDIAETMRFYARQFQSDTSKWILQMSVCSRADLVSALKDSSAPKRAAAAHTLAVSRMEAIAELLEAFAREQHGRVVSILLDALQILDQPEALYIEWQTRIRDERWPLLFRVGSDFASDFANRELSERWINEFKKRQVELGNNCHIMPTREHEWMILPGSYGGRVYQNPVYRLRLDEHHVEVFDAGMRPRLVAVAEIIGPRAVPVLKDILAEKDEFLQTEVAETLGKIGTPESISALSNFLSLADVGPAAEAAIKGLEETRSKQAVQPLIEVLRTPSRAREFCAQIGHAIGVLNEVSSLIHFAHQTGMQGDEYCRLATVSALRNCGRQDSEIEEILFTAAIDPEPHVRQEAVKGLASMKSPKAQEKLVGICLSDIEPAARDEAGKALRHFPGDAGIQTLVTALGHADDETRIRAVEALARIQDEKAIPALVKVLESTHPLTRIAAAKALDVLGFDQLDTLVQVLGSLARIAPDLKVRQEAAAALREFPDGEDKLYQPVRDALTHDQSEEVIQLIGSDTPFLPDDANLYWWRGRARYSLKRFQEALADFDRAIALTDCDAIVHLTRASVLADLNRFAEALAGAEKAAEIEPEDAENHFLAGWWAYRANALEKSVAASRRSLELNPKATMAAFNLGLALLASGQGLEAMDAYDRGIALCAESNKENALVTFDGALGDLEELIAERPEAVGRAEEAKTRLQHAREASVHRTSPPPEDEGARP